MFCSYDDIPVLGSIAIANNITVTTDSKTSIHRGKGQNMLFVMLSQDVRNKMPMLPSEETLLMTARSLTKEQRGYWPMVVGHGQVLIHLLALSKIKVILIKVVVTAMAMGSTCLQVSSSVISTVGWSCSECNQFGRHCMWSWNRNVDTDNIFEKVKYFRKLFKYK